MEIPVPEQGLGDRPVPQVCPPNPWPVGDWHWRMPMPIPVPDPPPVVEAAHSAASTTGGGPVGDFRMEIPVLLTANIQLVGS